jgi:crotonobetainyl-CoA:carnitine CoA-transferase CaiB-like acyl-CoA transferase
MPGALADLRVLDLSRSVAGAWCSRLLADFGADVITVEPPGGHPLRRLAPWDDKGVSIPARYYLANKRSIALDVADERDRDRARALGRRCDVVVSSARASELVASGLACADFGQPSLVLTHVTPFGMTGVRAELPGNDLTIAALSGWAFINGQIDREPLKMSGWQASMCAGAMAYAGTLAAIHYRDVHPGEGQEVDIAELDVMVSTFAPALLRGQYQGVAQQRRTGADMTVGPVPVADGHFSLTISRAHFWRDAMQVLGLPDLATDARWESGEYRATHKDEYVLRVQEAMSHWRKMDLFDELASRRVIAGPVLTMEELSANPQLRNRGFWVRPPTDQDRPEYAGAPVKLSATPWALHCGLPEAGADTADVLAAEGAEA